VVRPQASGVFSAEKRTKNEIPNIPMTRNKQSVVSSSLGAADQTDLASWNSASNLKGTSNQRNSHALLTLFLTSQVVVATHAQSPILACKTNITQSTANTTIRNA
jgi:hypothetical protein